MANKDFLGNGGDIFSDIFHEIEKVVGDVTMLANQKQPTMPIYKKFIAPDPGDLPDDPVEGQFAIDGSTDKAYFYSNGAWHKIGGEDIEWLFVDGFYQNDSPNPPFSFPFPSSGIGTGSYLPVKMAGSSDGIGGTFESENGVYTIDADGIFHMPDGLWLSFATLAIQHPSSISAASLASFSFASDSLGNSVGGTWRKNLPDINNVGGFHNWTLTLNSINRVQNSPLDDHVFTSQCDSTLRAATDLVASLSAVFVRITPEFVNIII